MARGFRAGIFFFLAYTKVPNAGRKQDTRQGSHYDARCCALCLCAKQRSLPGAGEQAARLHLRGAPGRRHRHSVQGEQGRAPRKGHLQGLRRPGLPRGLPRARGKDSRRIGLLQKDRRHARPAVGLREWHRHMGTDSMELHCGGRQARSTGSGAHMVRSHYRELPLLYRHRVEATCIGAHRRVPYHEGPDPGTEGNHATAPRRGAPGKRLRQ